MAASLDAIPLKLGPMSHSARVYLKMDGFFPSILKTETDVDSRCTLTPSEKCSTKVVEHSFTGPTHKKTQHQLNVSMD